MSGKVFLTYNQQMKKLRNDKGIECKGSSHKRILIRSGYFNLINGYKDPFISGTDPSGNHFYILGTNIPQIYAVKKFDDDLRFLIFKYITQVEEEVRTLAAYTFDDNNNHGAIPWYDLNAYSPQSTLQDKMHTVSSVYTDLTKSHQEYVQFYINRHSQIPTWIMMKAINLSTFIDVLSNSQMAVKHDICDLYSMYDTQGLPNVKLLIGSLHWLRKIRNSCAHNERIYRITGSGRIIENYISLLRPSYKKDKTENVFDLLVYMKYYLPRSEFKQLITGIEGLLKNLQGSIHPHAFNFIRGKMGIKNLQDLQILISLPKTEIEYNRFR